MGDDPPHRPGPWGVPTSGLSTDHGEAAPAAIGWELGLPSDGDSNAGRGFEEMEEYVTKKYNTTAQYIVTRPILDLRKETVQMPGMWV